ncbi:hypothetical protein LQW54_007600 [Pestalotiopsis sp. IQ-011]
MDNQQENPVPSGSIFTRPQNNDELTKFHDEVAAAKNEARRRATTDTLSSRDSIAPWKESTPDIRAYDPEGQELATQGSYISRRWQLTSDTGDSDGLSSVVSITDLGLDAAPRPPQNGFVACGLDKVADADIEEAIRKRVVDGLQVSKMDVGGEYLPIDKFDAIFSPEAVKLLIKAPPEMLAGDLQHRLDHITGFNANQSFLRILATLVMVKNVSHIWKFIEKNVGDGDMPIRREPVSSGGLTTRHDRKVPDFFGDWERNDVELFYIYQRFFFVPFFDIREEQLYEYQFSNEVTLPWQEYEAKTSGGSGVIHRVQIHPKHFKFPNLTENHQSCNGQTSADHQDAESDQRPVDFALKEIYVPDRDAYKQELRALEKSFGSKQNDRHLIKLLLTFQHGEKCYLLFEWADGNLEEFWEVSKNSVRISDSWAANQCLGLATALKRIHGLMTWQKERRKAKGLGAPHDIEWGRHGDIKPRNILWFKSYGSDCHHLVISDLGLTQFHTESSRSAVPISRISGYTRAYRPPEMDLGYRISQNYDLWSLGCVFLEFCIWYVFDASKVQKFEDMRVQQDRSEISGFQEGKFFNIAGESGQRKAVLKPIVKEVIRKLREADECTQFVRKILRLVEHEMLQVEPDKRNKIDLICRELQDIKNSSSFKDAESPLQSIQAKTSQSSLAVDENEVIGEASSQEDIHRSPLDEKYDSDFHHAHGGDSTVMKTTNSNAHHQALSICSENAESEEEPIRDTADTEANMDTNQATSEIELPQDNADDRRLRRNASTDSAPSDKRRLAKFESTAARTDFIMPTQTTMETSSSMTTMPENTASQQEVQRIKPGPEAPSHTKEDESEAPPEATSSSENSGIGDQERRSARHLTKKMWKDTVQSLRRRGPLRRFFERINVPAADHSV